MSVSYVKMKVFTLKISRLFLEHMRYCRLNNIFHRICISNCSFVSEKKRFIYWGRKTCFYKWNTFKNRNNIPYIIGKINQLKDFIVCHSERYLMHSSYASDKYNKHSK